MEYSPSVQFTASTTNFSYSLFREFSASNDGNLFASTYSIQLLLLLLTIGSKSKTNDDLLSVLRMPKSRSYEKVKTVIEHIEAPDYLTVANGVFTDNAFELSADFENQARNYLKSEVGKFDFAGNPSVGESFINKWTSNKTNGKIPKLFDAGSISSDTALVLTSAVHFQNKWKNRFTETKNEKFCVSAKEHIDVQLMHRTGHFQYYKDDVNRFSAVELPYKGGNFQMLVVLPDKMDGIKAMEKAFLSDSSNFPALLANMTIHNVVLALPKFKFDSNINLVKSLSNMGCGDMFTPKADFSALSSSGAGKLKVSDIKHKTFVDVNEEGTEAAGVTGATIVKYKLEYVPENIKTVHFHACHPFLFFIKKGNDIVFMGRLANPTV